MLILRNQNGSGGTGDGGQSPSTTAADPPGPLEERERPDLATGFRQALKTAEPPKADEVPINRPTSKRIKLHMQAIQGFCGFIKTGDDPVYWAGRIEKEVLELDDVLKNPIAS